MKGARITAAIWCLFVIWFYIIKDSFLAVLLLAGTVSVLLLCGLLVLAGGKNCSLTVLASGTISKKEPLVVEVKLKTHSLIPIGRYSFLMVCKNGITGEEERVPLCLGAGIRGTSYTTVTLSSKYCGYVEYTLEDAKITDPLYLFFAGRKSTAQAGTYVMPDIQELNINSSQLDAYNMESYSYSSSQKGSDPSETFGIREYAQGDSPKTIHWKLTGKLGQVMVRELGLPIENSIMILLDKRTSTKETIEPDLRDRAVELFLSLSHTLVKKEMFHSVGWQDYKNGCFITKRVACQQDLWEISGQVLESPYAEDSVPTAVHYLENCGDQRFANYLYVTAGSSSDTEMLEGHGAITIYRAESYK